MACERQNPQYAERLLAYAGDRLGREQSALVEEHLRDCPDCRQFVSAQRSVFGALDAWEAPPVAPGFDRKLYERIRNEVPWWALLARPFRPLLWQAGVAVASLLVLLGGAGWLARRAPERVQPAAVAGTAEPGSDQLQRALADMETLRQLNQVVPPEPQI